jgi:hypothetical protein
MKLVARCEICLSDDLPVTCRPRIQVNYRHGVGASSSRIETRQVTKIDEAYQAAFPEQG